MEKITKEIAASYDELFEKRKQAIINSKDDIKITGTAYYVSNSGDDSNDGKSDATAWKTLKKVHETDFQYGDGVFFKRGDVFRGCFHTRPGVTYAAYGEGKKPQISAGDKDLANKDFWEIYDKEHNIWKLKEKHLCVGTLVFNEGEAVSRKLIPSFIGGKFVCRNNIEKEFSVSEEMTEDLDVFWYYKDTLTDGDNPVPKLVDEALGDLYLRCDKGNPGEIYSSIEPLSRRHTIRSSGNKDVRIDNICFKYVGEHAIAAGGNCVPNLTITNCEFGWIGGSIQFYHADVDNPRFGQIVRFGNAIEIYGGCKGYVAHNNYIYEVYDAGVTHQVGSASKIMQEDIEYSDNVIERCVYGIEYFLGQSGPEKGKIRNCVMKNNFIRLGGYGWGKQRPDITCPSLIKSWDASNLSENFVIKDNIFDRCTQTFLHISAYGEEDFPTVDNNTYIQNLDGPLGMFGANKNGRSPMYKFDINAEETIKTVIGDKNAKVYYTD